MADAIDTEFRIGRVINRSFTVFTQNFLRFGAVIVLLTILSYGLGLLIVVPAMISVSSGSQWTTGVAIGVMVLVVMALQYLAMAILSYGAFQALTGEKVRFGRMIARGLASGLPVILLAFVMTILIGLGMMLFIIPGIVMVIMFLVAIPVAVVERPGIFGSLGRSIQLTKGHRWQVLGIIAVLFLILIGFGVASAALGFIVPGLGDAVSIVGNLFTSGLVAIIPAVAYHDLRVAKEGIGIEQIVAVFD